MLGQEFSPGINSLILGAFLSCYLLIGHAIYLSTCVRDKIQTVPHDKYGCSQNGFNFPLLIVGH